MKRYKLIFSLALALILILVLVPMTDQAEAGPRVTRAHALETFCSIGAPERFWFDGNIVQGRNQPLTSIVESRNPNFAGTGEIIGNWMLNIETSKGHEWGTYESTVSDNEGGGAGTWSGRARLSSVIMADGSPWWLLNGHGSGYGYGSSYGLEYYFMMRQTVNVYDTLDEAEDSAPCVTGMTIDGRWFVAQSKNTFFITRQGPD